MKLAAIFISLFLMVQGQVRAQDRRAKLLSLINEELKQTERLSQRLRDRDPGLLLKISELYYEKAVIQKEVENQHYLSKAASSRRGMKKSSFFQKSNALLLKSQKKALFLISRHPKYKKASKAFYLLGLLAAERGQKKKSGSYFSKSVRTGGDFLSKLALAGHYYNNENFSQAVKYYEQALSHKKYRLWTKEAFNLAWCYYRLGNYSRSLSLMHEIVRKGKSKQYANVEAMVYNHIGLVYIRAGKIKGALRFFEKNKQDIQKHLQALAENLLEQGKFTDAEYVLSAMIERLKVNNPFSVYLSLLELYQRQGKYKEHLKIADLAAKTANAKNDTAFIRQLKKGAQETQKKALRSSGKKGRLYSSWSKKYFFLLAQLDPKREGEYRFLAGEMLYREKKYKLALEQYSKALDKGDPKALQTLLSLLADKSVPHRLKAPYRLNVYQSYLKQFPKGKLSEQIYKKLFTAYLEKKKGKNALVILDKFHRIYAHKRLVQEAMVAELITYYKKTDNKNGLAAISGDVQRGEYNLGEKFRKKVILEQHRMKFKKIESYLAKGKNQLALKEYLKLLDDPKSSKQVLKNAAYNASVLFQKEDMASSAYKWGKKALSLMRPREVHGFSQSFLDMALYFFEAGHFKWSLDISNMSLKKICKKKNSWKSYFYKNIWLLKAAQGQMGQFPRAIGVGLKCGIKREVLSKTADEVLFEMRRLEKWGLIVQTVKALDLRSIRTPFLPVFVQDLIHYYESRGQMGQAKDYKGMISRIQTHYLPSKSRFSVPLEVLDIYGLRKLDLIKREYNSIFARALRFPESQFNRNLQAKLQRLDQLTKKTIQHSQTGSFKTYAESYYLISLNYLKMAKAIENFTPSGVSAGYKKSFKAAMADIFLPLKSRASEFKKTARNNIRNMKALTDKNPNFLFQGLLSSIPLGLVVEGKLMSGRN